MEKDLRIWVGIEPAYLCDAIYQLSYLALGSKVVGRKGIQVLVFGVHVFHQINWTILGDLHANIHTWSYMLMMWVCEFDPHSNLEIFPCKNTSAVVYGQVNNMDNLRRNQAWMLGSGAVPPPLQLSRQLRCWGGSTLDSIKLYISYRHCFGGFYGI